MADVDAVAKAALEVLLATKLEQQAAVSDQLLREIYETEVRLQYDDDRSPAVAAIRKAVEAEVDREIAAEEGAE
jgi:hypothetical protein